MEEKSFPAFHYASSQYEQVWGGMCKEREGLELGITIGASHLLHHEGKGMMLEEKVGKYYWSFLEERYGIREKLLPPIIICFCPFSCWLHAPLCSSVRSVPTRNSTLGAKWPKWERYGSGGKAKCGHS